MNFLTPAPSSYLTEFGTSSKDLINQIREAMHPHGVARQRRIEELASSQGIDPTIASQTYDFSAEVPLTTNMAMLNHCGVYPSSPEDVMLSGDWRGHIFYVADALAGLNIFLIRSNSLTDEECYRKMWKLMHDEVKFLPPSAGVSEFVDLCPEQSDCADWHSSEPYTNAGYDRDSMLPKSATH